MAADIVAGNGGQQAGLSLENVSKSYGSTLVLRGIDLTVPVGEIHALLGPSGSGKTTLLKVIAGFVQADGGEVRLNGVDLTHVPPERRDVGVVFQNYALFPHMNVFENVAFGLKMRRVRRGEVRERVAEVLRLVRLTGLESRRPTELSGGQQQRVAVARALVIRPAVLLLDEPLSALDRKVRQEVREELKRIQAETKVTTVFVTHDQEEALFLAHRVVVLEGGVTRQNDEPTRVYSRPADEFVAGFVGSVNLFATAVDESGPDPIAEIRVGNQRVHRQLEQLASPPGGAEGWIAAVRPETVRISRLRGKRSGSDIHGVISEIDFGGPTAAITVKVDDQTVSVLVLSPAVTGQDALAKGDPVVLDLPQRVSLLASGDVG